MAQVGRWVIPWKKKCGSGFLDRTAPASCTELAGTVVYNRYRVRLELSGLVGVLSSGFQRNGRDDGEKL